MTSTAKELCWRANSEAGCWSYEGDAEPRVEGWESLPRPAALLAAPPAARGRTVRTPSCPPPA